MIVHHIGEGVRRDGTTMPIVIHHHILHMVARVASKVEGSIVSPRHNHLREGTTVRGDTAVLTCSNKNGVLYSDESHCKSMIPQHRRNQVAEGGLEGSC